jgi:hypothetical protein
VKREADKSDCQKNGSRYHDPMRIFHLGEPAEEIHRFAFAPADTVSREAFSRSVGLDLERPISTSRRMASERLGKSGCPAAQASRVATNSSERRNVREGSEPVAGRPAPRRFPPTFFRIAFFTFKKYAIQA